MVRLVFRLLTVSFCCGVVPILAIIFLTLPENAAACGPQTCVCGSERNTGSIWEMGATCGEALQNAVNAGRSRFTCPNDVCSETVVIDTPCWFNATEGEYQVDLHILYKCEECSFGECV